MHAMDPTAAEIIDAEQATRAYESRIGSEAFLNERNALHDAWRATAQRMSASSTSLDVAKAMSTTHRTEDNWGLLVLVFAERLWAEQAHEDFLRDASAREPGTH